MTTPDPGTYYADATAQAEADVAKMMQDTGCDRQHALWMTRNVYARMIADAVLDYGEAAPRHLSIYQLTTRMYRIELTHEKAG